MGLIHGNNIGGGGGGAGADEKAKVSANDTTAGYLNGKLVAGTNITFTENNDGGDETLTIAAGGGAFYDQSVSPTNGQTSFSLDFLPTNNSSVFMIINGITFTPGKGFIISGTTITWGESFTIQDSDVILLRYKK